MKCLCSSGSLEEVYLEPRRLCPFIRDDCDQVLEALDNTLNLHAQASLWFRRQTRHIRGHYKGSYNMNTISTASAVKRALIVHPLISSLLTKQETEIIWHVLPHLYLLRNLHALLCRHLVLPPVHLFELVIADLSCSLPATGFSITRVLCSPLTL